MSINYRQLRTTAQIEEILSWMQWESSSRVGDQLRGVCPLCATSRTDTASPGSSRTFSVNTQRNIYRCFRCGSGGNALDLWSSYRKLSLYTAAEEIQSRLSENKQP
jgi:DNA primase